MFRRCSKGRADSNSHAGTFKHVSSNPQAPVQLQAAFQHALSALAPAAASNPSGRAIKPSGAECTASELCSLLQASDVATNAASACPSAALESLIAAALQLHLRQAHGLFDAVAAPGAVACSGAVWTPHDAAMSTCSTRWFLLPHEAAAALAAGTSLAAQPAIRKLPPASTALPLRRGLCSMVKSCFSNC